MSKEKILEEFEKIDSYDLDMESQGSEAVRKIFKDFLSKAIDKTREETIRLEQERIYAYVEEILIGCDNKLLKDLSNIIFNKSN